MPEKLTKETKEKIVELLRQGLDKDVIANSLGVTRGQVSAISAHIKMGTYSKPQKVPSDNIGDTNLVVVPAKVVPHSTPNLLDLLRSLQPQVIDVGQVNQGEHQGVSPIWVGNDLQTQENVFWNTDPNTGSANPHLLILGKSGFGKTYAITSILSELAQRDVVPVVFDYGQGFTTAALPQEFQDKVELVEINAAVEGIDINPFQIFPNDVLGPLNVAQRIADTFARVYPKIGIQQHTVLRQAALDTMADAGITQDKSTWENPLPAFRNLELKLRDIAVDTNVAADTRRHASTVASHISTVFVFNTFRSNGRKLTWNDVLDAQGAVFVLQLKGLEASLEKVVTEFLLWNMIGFFESIGQGPLRCFAVLDEAHKLSCDGGSPVEYLLRVARKFGLGLILASQQPEDFSSVAFANSATKMVFQVNDEKGNVASNLTKSITNNHDFNDIAGAITKVPRGFCYFVSENIGRVVKFPEISQRQ